MIRHALSLLLASSALAQPVVTNLVLNPREAVVVPVAIDRLTTICFPGTSSIARLEAAFVSTDAEPPARFQLAFKGGSCFSVRALLPNATASVNVLWNRQTYVFELVSSAKPILALTLVEPLARDTRASRQSPGSHRLLGILDTAKAYSLLREQHPAEVAEVTLIRRQDRYDFGGYEIVLEEVLRFQTEDTLVFRVLLRNRARTLLRYLPQSFRVRVGERTFYAAMADGDGTVPPLAQVTVYFAITSGPDGTNHHLSPQNDFLVLVTVPEPPEAPPVQPARPPARSPKHHELLH